MTRDEAVDVLKANYPDACYGELREAVDMAIEALRAQDGTDVNGDMIYRQAAIDAFDCSVGGVPVESVKYVSEYADKMMNRINALSSAQPEKTQLSREDTTSDCIIRQSAINIVYFECGEWEGLAKSIVKDINDLPSAQPETCEGCKHLGKWENEVEYGYPSSCTCCKRRAWDHYER